MTHRTSRKRREGRFRGQQLVAHKSTTMLSIFAMYYLVNGVSISFITKNA